MLTRVMLAFIPDRLNVWLRFGDPVCERLIDRHRRLADFAPDAVFGYVYWQGNRHGTTQWHFQVLRTVCAGERAQRVRGVAPGAEILLRVSGSAKLRHVLTMIDAIEAQGISAVDVSRAYWRTAHNRYAANLEPAPYDAQSHAASLARRAIESME